MEKKSSKEGLPVSFRQNTSLTVKREVLEEAEREGSSREFFFKLMELLSGLSRKEVKELNHEKLVKEIVKANQLEEFFFPSKSKNIYSALRKAFRQKLRSEVEKEWEKKLKSWREEFEEKLHRAASRYLLKVENWELMRELYRREWLLPSEILNSFKGEAEEFESWIAEVSTEKFLRSRVENWMELPPFKRREKIVRDILKAHRLNCLELGIYGLFPLSEGVVWDTFVKENTLEADIEALIRKRNRKFVTIQYTVKLIVERVFSEEEIPPFLDWHPFVDYREGTLNRHAIQHGVAVNFGTKENFLKLFYFVDFLSEITGYLLESIR